MGDRATVVWDASLLGYDLGGEHPFNPIRLELTMRLAAALGVLDGVTLQVPEPAAESDIERVHELDYVRAVQRAPTVGWDVGHGLGSADNPVFDRMHTASALVVGGSLLGARHIAEGTVDRAVSIAGGLHHAMRDHASGFCVYNDCAVAISWLLDNGFDRVAYLDVDVHHGDGVQAAFYDDPRVLTVSLHQSPMTLWPGTGFVNELGGRGAQGSAVNIPLAPYTRDAAWLRAFTGVVPSLLKAFRPQILVTQCGVDTHEEDPLADLALSVDGHRAIYRTLRDLADRYAGGKWLATGGGGYQLLRVVPRSWTHLIATVLDRDVAPETRVPAQWTASVRKIAPNADLPLTMSDGRDTAFEPWDGGLDQPVDAVIRDVRRAVFPLHGLDPDDPRD
ncbi:NAD-independent protein deacetylase AcuC [Alloactinosynnema sp. L-07]|uniref:acetoin utilization protein AcuC n=1 Tax=Alloactinosynnema sp. L-07 TaxID=1653480 RepID=UPI00065EF855|nr:acetoin utilization protein AcuC [Alloactinosynnema sp. L-07]CRK55794.1 NAD-independent protein deacetylase AcuC [Alloactinosynnema sp. L-07]